MRKWLLILVGVTVFTSVTLLSLSLLKSQHISGGEFSAIFISFAVLSLLICLLPEVQNFSIAGNSVTFKEVKQEAQKAIQELQEAQIETMRLLFVAIGQTSGIKSLDAIPIECEKFWGLHAKVVDLGFELNLSEEITHSSEELLQACIFLFDTSSAKVKSELQRQDTQYVEPQILMALLLEEPDLKHKDLVTETLVHYQKLWVLSRSQSREI
ncbi:hypothetical protein [Vibrio sp. ED002]|uniref:hypothetical protein n=1 Tax=Vibrio sp. ED002 TaxID=2785123 RepID=UPI0020107D64|nr:hypothetical protein [Vibrio sp. ED002]UQA50977.1 hypothetical protein ITG12_01140 [Vibrio sp. ED002]